MYRENLKEWKIALMDVCIDGWVHDGWMCSCIDGDMMDGWVHGGCMHAWMQ